MNVTIKPIHIGKAIEQRRQELGINKSELARRINIPQQHINRILSNSSMDTEKLAKISEALEYNFFDLFASSGHEAKTPDTPPSHSEYSTPGTVKVKADETEPHSSSSTHVESASPALKDLTIQVLQEKNRILEELVESKNRIICLLEEKFSQQP